MIAKFRSYFSIDNLLPILAVGIALSWVWSTVGVTGRNFEFQRRVDELRQQNTLMEIQNKSLEYRITYYQTKEFAELAAREDLNKAAPGEKVLIVPPSSHEGRTTFSTSAKSTKDLPVRSNFQQWMYFLFGRRDE